MPYHLARSDRSPSRGRGLGWGQNCKRGLWPRVAASGFEKQHQKTQAHASKQISTKTIRYRIQKPYHLARSDRSPSRGRGLGWGQNCKRGLWPRVTASGFKKQSRKNASVRKQRNTKKDVPAAADTPETFCTNTQPTTSAARSKYAWRHRESSDHRA